VELLLDRIEIGPQTLDSEPEVGGDPGPLQLLAKMLEDVVDLLIVLQLAEPIFQLVGLAGEFITQGQIVEFALELIEPDDPGHGGIDIEGFLGDLLPLVLGHGRHGPQVVEPVGQLDQHDFKTGG
jgi:hypothetical protein